MNIKANIAFACCCCFAAAANTAPPSSFSVLQQLANCS
jgi:hypothetical protein